MYLLSILGWGIGVFGAQRILQRFMAIESEAKISSSRNIGMTWITATYFFSMAVGLLALPVLIENGVLDQIIDDPERLYFVLTNTLFHPIVVGILLVAVIAAVMSTADSQLLLGVRRSDRRSSSHSTLQLQHWHRRSDVARKIVTGSNRCRSRTLLDLCIPNRCLT